MHFTTLAFAAFTALSSAAALDRRQTSDLCPSGKTPQCCQLDVDGVASLTCAPPSSGLATVEDFNADCAEDGTTAQCCVLPVAGAALLCSAPA